MKKVAAMVYITVPLFWVYQTLVLCPRAVSLFPAGFVLFASLPFVLWHASKDRRKPGYFDLPAFYCGCLATLLSLMLIFGDTRCRPNNIVIGDRRGIHQTSMFRPLFSGIGTSINKEQTVDRQFTCTTKDGFQLSAQIKTNMSLTTDTQRLHQMFLDGRLDEKDGAVSCRGTTPADAIEDWLRAVVRVRNTQDWIADPSLKAAYLKVDIEQRFPVSWDGIIELKNVQLTKPPLLLTEGIRITP